MSPEQFQNLYIDTREYRCIIPHHHIINEKVYYITLVMSYVSHNLTVLKLRYSDFQQFNEQLEKAIVLFRLPVLLPQFPGKKFFGSTSSSPKFINQRRQEIQDYMNLVLQIDKLYSLPIMKKILPLGQEKEGTLAPICQNIEYPQQQYSFSIESYQQLDDIVLYYIQITDQYIMTKWRFKARYSDLRDIHRALKEQKLSLILPEFPKRKIFGITNESPDKIEIRKLDLVQYLNQLFSFKELISNEVLIYFIENSKRESQRIKKFDEQKIIANLVIYYLYVEKFKAQMVSRKLGGKETKADDSPVKKMKAVKKGLYIIKECKLQYEGQPQDEQQQGKKRENKLDQLEEIINQYVE